MEDALALRLNSLRPVIKHRWTELLRSADSGAPAGAAVVTPEMLFFMVDDTLGRLTKRLGTPRDELEAATLAPFKTIRAGCHCGLHLLLTYYLSGAKALRSTLPSAMGHRRVVVIHQFNQLAHEEMMSLCGVCQHRGGARCSLRGAKDLLSGLDSSGL